MSWKISRAGVINFWYYDEEEFQFEDGRLLLRGSNGSGKSVTMQSLVPLLFDGNKSPERLDPFGSKARKMESYLLSDGLDLEERTGYLYLEFEKKESQRYISIGMGMRARKNMPLQTWYFVLLDNRRIGKKHDFNLYKDLGDKIPLTQRELENKIALGGQVFTKQSDYKAAVNEHLFGYSDITDFDELITLLIQIRSPKLSKEFKPTTMYEIMQNSLVTLSDDDLRPMSEAIENMDEIKLKIEALERSKKSLMRIQTAFDKYNAFMLTTKASRFLNYVNQETQHSKALKLKTEETKETTGSISVSKNAILALEDEEISLKQQEASLLKHDLNALANEATVVRADIQNQERVLSQKTQKLEQQASASKDLERQIQVKQNECEQSEHNLTLILESLKELAEDAGFDEHHFFEEEYAKNTEIPDFKHHKVQVLNYQNRIKATAKALRRQDDIKAQYDLSLERVDQATRMVETQNRHLKDAERQFNQIKEEFAANTFTWAEKNKHLDFPRTILSKVTERILNYRAPYRFDQALEPLREAYEQLKGSVHQSLHMEKSQRQLTLKTIEALEEKKIVIKNQKDIEPERSQATLKNRQRLEAKGIKHVPLYKALDFSTDLTDSQKDILEEALDAMGLLDALVVEEKHKSEVLSMGKGEAERYVFASPEFLSHNLTAFFKVEETAQPFGKSIIEDVLMSVFVNETENRFYITEEGYYGMGLLKGKVSGEKSSCYIGQQARKRYRERLLMEIETELQLEQEKLETIEMDISQLENRLEFMHREWETFPNNTDLEVAYETVLEAQGKLVLLQKEENHLREISETYYQALKNIKLEVVNESKGLYLNLTLEVYDIAEHAMEGYVSEFSEWIQVDQSIRYVKAHLNTLYAQKEISDEAEEALRYDITQAERLKYKAVIRLEDIENQLKISEYDAIRAEVDRCKSRLAEIPMLYKREVKLQSDNEAKLVQLEMEIERLTEQLQHIAQKRALYENAFRLEYGLGYLLLDKDIVPEKTIELAKLVLVQEGHLLQEQKTILHYSDALKEKFLSETGELAEYQMRLEYLFKELCDDSCSDDDITHIERADLTAKVQGKYVNFKTLDEWIEMQIIESVSLLNEQDRALFEEILINSISKNISGKIYHSEKWVRKIDELMNSMDTSSGLSFHLKWVTKEASSEDQLSTKELVNLLKTDQALLTREQKDKLIRHFQSKIAESKRRSQDESDSRSFLLIMKEILDYRKWFEFQLDYTKKGERRRELTNNAFFTFSGGEKAMAMYVPLFSAVYAKYTGANRDCPKLVSLDEAFAGVDEKNITDMFRLLVKELNLGFIANSQVLYGDYETVPSLAIYELIRPANATYVTTIRYKWNGKVRELMPEE